MGSPRRRISVRKAAKKNQNNKNKQRRKTVRKKEKMKATQPVGQLPIPAHFDPKAVGTVRRVEYGAIAAAAHDYRRKHGVTSASRDQRKVVLMIVDAQNTFCIPNYELYVGGRSGTGAIDDNRRLCEFIYRNLGLITQISPTMDTHIAMQIFHQFFFVNDKGEHPVPVVGTPPVNAANLKNGTWKVNPDIAWSLTDDKSPAGVAKRYNALQEHAIFYCEKLESSGNKFALTIWPYHGMLGGIGHALVAAVEEACFFHNIARASQTDFQIKGGSPLSENYSILQPEVLVGRNGVPVGQKNARFIRTLLMADRVIIAGQAKSHCVAWTIADLLNEIKTVDPDLAGKVYLMEDCTSPVTVPNPAGGFFVDFTDGADAAFAGFAKAGMHLVKSTDPVDTWADWNA